MLHISKKYLKMANLYETIGRDWPDCPVSYDRAMLEEMFIYESHGLGELSKNNGFALGKHWLDVTVSIWFEDQAKGEFSLYELRKYPGKIPLWFIDKVFGKE